MHPLPAAIAPPAGVALISSYPLSSFLHRSRLLSVFLYNSVLSFFLYVPLFQFFFLFFFLLYYFTFCIILCSTFIFSFLCFLLFSFHFRSRGSSVGIVTSLGPLWKTLPAAAAHTGTSPLLSKSPKHSLGPTQPPWPPSVSPDRY